MLSYNSVQELVDAANENKCRISEICLKDQAKKMGISEEEVYKSMEKCFDIMIESAEWGEQEGRRSTSGLTGDEGFKMTNYAKNGGGLMGTGDGYIRGGNAGYNTSNPYYQPFIDDAKALDAAKVAYDDAKAAMQSATQELYKIRAALQEDLKQKYTPKAADLDLAAVELLKSGILKPDEMQRMMQEAFEAGNMTMCRTIQHYANEASAREQQQNGGRDTERARAFRTVANMPIDNGASGYSLNEHDKLQAFDVLTDALSRILNNPQMADYWDELTAPIVSNF